ncbi:MAG: VWA domain-containing protein [Lentimicrobium sp.]|nr:VWA domain-containing protein [Lentimicrobium sp.]
MFRFEYPIYLNFLLALPLLILLFWVYLRWKKKVAEKLGDTHVVKRLMIDISPLRVHLKFIFFMLSLVSLLLALANPQIGSRLEKVQRKGIDLVIAIDVSNSMLAQDIQPNRLERARQSVSRLIDELENDRIGLIVFAGKAYTQLPITTDYNAAKMMLSTIKPELVPVQGTAIGQAIDMGMASFKEEGGGKAIIVITDGENHEDDAVSKAEDAASKGINVYTIGMGLADGAPIPEYRNNQMTGFKKDRSGNTVITRLDEPMLEQIARAGNGIYVRASNTQAGLRRVYEEIGKLEQNTYESHSYADFDDRFQYFIALTLVFLMLSFVINEKKSKWASKFKIFNLN